MAISALPFVNCVSGNESWIPLTDPGGSFSNGTTVTSVNPVANSIGSPGFGVGSATNGGKFASIHRFLVNVRCTVTGDLSDPANETGNITITLTSPNQTVTVPVIYVDGNPTMLGATNKRPKKKKPKPATSKSALNPRKPAKVAMAPKKKPGAKSALSKSKTAHAVTRAKPVQRKKK